MLKYILNLTIVVVAFFLHFTNLKSQDSYEWFNESASSNRSNYMTLNANDFILNSRQSFNDQILKIDKDGNEICLKNICNCDTLEIEMSARLPNYTLLLNISSQGELILTDHSGEYADQIGQITNLEFGGIRHIEKTDSHIYIRAKVSQNGDQGLLRTSINLDLNSLEIKSNVEWGSNNLLSFDIDEQNNRITELFSSSNEHIVQIRELGNDEILINEFVVTDDFDFNLLDISFYDEISIVVSGSGSDQDESGGLIKLVDFSGLNLWRKVIPYSDIIKLPSIFVKDGNILLGGSIGSWLVRAAYLVQFNSDGEILWERVFNIYSNRQDEIHQVLIDDDGNIFANGTAGSSDVSGAERSFVMKISDPKVGLTEFTKRHFEVYPNPSSSILYISGNMEDVRSVTIVNNIGETIFNKKDSEVIDVSNFSDGIYFIIIESGNEFFTRKFIKQ